MKKLLALALMSFLVTNVWAEKEDHSKHSKPQHTKDKHSDKHSDEKHAVKSLSLNNGKKWEIDQTMRENMDAIRLQFQKVNQSVSSKKITDKDYTELSDLISKSTQQIASTCKLEPKADETFHVVLANLITVTEDLKSPKMAKHALEKLNHALKIYSEYFNHPASI